MTRSNGAAATGPTRRLRVVLGSGARFSLAGLRGVVGELSGVDVVAEARDLPNLRFVVEGLWPDAAIVDLTLGSLGCPLDLLDLRKVHPGLGLVVFVEVTTDPRDLAQLARAGGTGLLTADARTSDLAVVLCAVTAGFSIICPWLLQQAIPATPPRQGLPHSALALTSREKTVLGRLARGDHERAIADELGISLRTVQAIINRARARLGATDRTHAVALALEAGLLLTTAESSATTR